MKTNHKLISLILVLGIIFQAQAQKDDFILIVVDVQEFKTVKEKIPPNIYKDFIHHVNKTIESFDADRVAYIKDMSLASSLSFKGITIDTISLAEFDKDLLVVNSNIYIKSEGDSFTAKGLGGFLSKYSETKFW